MDNFEAATITRDGLDRIMKEAGFALDKFPRQANGLTPDDVKFSREYRTAKVQFDNAFANLRKFNQYYVRTYKKEIAAARKAKRQA